MLDITPKKINRIPLAINNFNSEVEIVIENSTYINSIKKSIYTQRMIPSSRVIQKYYNRNIIGGREHLSFTTIDKPAKIVKLNPLNEPYRESNNMYQYTNERVYCKNKDILNKYKKYRNTI